MGFRPPDPGKFKASVLVDMQNAWRSSFPRLWDDDSGLLGQRSDSPYYQRRRIHIPEDRSYAEVILQEVVTRQETIEAIMRFCEQYHKVIQRI